MSFSITIDSPKLCRGLRPSKRMPRNSSYLVECSGAVGRDQVLQTFEELSRIDTSAILDTFPFPQLFVFTNFIIVCSSTKIYELVGGILEEKLTVSGGSTWTVIESHEFVYMSNGTVAVLRDTGTKEYVITTAQPDAMALCNFNGQVLAGAPDVEGGIPGASLTMDADPFDLTISQHGYWWSSDWN